MKFSLTILFQKNLATKSISFKLIYALRVSLKTIFHYVLKKNKFFQNIR
jgi:hypothetical protein